MKSRWWWQRLRSWLAQGRPLWWLLLVLGVGLLIAVGPGTTEVRIRVVGWALEICGLFTVALGIQQARRHFDHKSFSEIARDYLKAFPGRRPPIVATIGTAEERDTANAIGVVIGKAKPTSVKERIAVLEASVVRIDGRVDQLYHDQLSEVDARKAAVSGEMKTREQEDAAIRLKLEALHTGGVYVSLIGVIWLAAGLTLSTLPDVLLCWRAQLLAWVG